MAKPRHTFAVVNHKGGVGKTTTVVNLAGALASAGRRVLVVDADPQAHATLALLGPGEHQPGLPEMIEHPGPTVHLTRITNEIDILPGHRSLQRVQFERANQPGHENLLRQVLHVYRKSHDVVLIDCPPSLDLLSVAALAAADSAIVPVGPALLDVDGVRLVYDTIDAIRSNLDHPRLAVLGILINRVPPHGNIYRTTIRAIRESLGDAVFETEIPQTVVVEEARQQIQTVVRFRPNDRISNCYRSLALEVLSRAEV